jgi:hypothetical protein
MSPEREAEELRSGIEKLIEKKGETARALVASYDEDERVVKAADLLDLLDRVDARDSLRFLEKKARRKARKPPARKAGKR